MPVKFTDLFYPLYSYVHIGFDAILRLVHIVESVEKEINSEFSSVLQISFFSLSFGCVEAVQEMSDTLLFRDGHEGKVNMKLIVV
jgi:hypothetical protein